VLSGPSGVGKATVIQHIRRQLPELKWSVSFTTRAPRPGEADGIDYHFVSELEFDTAIADGTLLEWAVFNGNRYGTPRPPVGQDVLVENGFDLAARDINSGQGAVAVKQNYPAATLIWIMPPGGVALIRLVVLGRRLLRRGTENSRVIAARLKIARQEMKLAPPFYDYVVVNRNAAKAAARICDIITAAK